MINFKILGVTAAVSFLSKKDRNINGSVENAMQKVGLFMQGEVKESIAGRKAEHVSVDTGRFLNSVEEKSDKKRATIWTPLNYPSYLEYGTSRISARPHFGNSLKRNKPKLKEYLNRELRNI